MYGLYDALNWDLEPLCKVNCNFLMVSQINRLKTRLVVQAGLSVAEVPAFVS